MCIEKAIILNQSAYQNTNLGLRRDDGAGYWLIAYLLCNIDDLLGFLLGHMINVRRELAPPAYLGGRKIYLNIAPGHV